MIMKYDIEYTYRYHSNIHVTNNVENNDIKERESANSNGAHMSEVLSTMIPSVMS